MEPCAKGLFWCQAITGNYADIMLISHYRELCRHNVNWTSRNKLQQHLTQYKEIHPRQCIWKKFKCQPKWDLRASPDGTLYDPLTATLLTSYLVKLNPYQWTNHKTVPAAQALVGDYLPDKGDLLLRDLTVRLAFNSLWPFGVSDHDQHCFVNSLLPDGTKVLPGPNMLMRSCDIHAISLNADRLYSKITHLKLQPHTPGTNR